MTAKRGHLSAVPVSSCEPRSAKEIPDPDDQVFDGPGDEDLGRLRLGGDAADDVNGDSPDLVADQVHFPVWIPARSCLSCSDRGADILRPA